MTNTTFPLDKICDALNLLQLHGVIGDNTADGELGQWLIENDLTTNDLNNYRYEQASRERINELASFFLLSHNDDAKELATTLVYHHCDGARADEVDNLISEFKEAYES